MTCKCIEEFNERLAPHNGKIDVALALVDNMTRMVARPQVATRKIDAKKRKPVPVVMAAFCPFCGVNLGED